MEKISAKDSSKGMKVIFIICIILSVLGLIGSVYVCDSLSTDVTYVVAGIATTIIYLGLFLYAGFGYKRPHGNALRYIFILFGLAYGVIVGMKLTGIIAIFGIIVVGMACYIAGRLNKIKKNAVLIIIVLVLTLLIALYQAVHFLQVSELTVIGNIMFLLFVFSPFISWAGLSSAYVVRYKTHKEAGLLDKNE